MTKSGRMSFLEVHNNLTLNKICAECVILVEIESIPTDGYHQTLLVKLRNNQSNQFSVLATNPQYVASDPADYNFQISELHYLDRNILITRSLNPGSGGGALYGVFAIDQHGLATKLQTEIFACDGPTITVLGELEFKNNGHHCSWFDAGGSPESIKVDISKSSY